MVIGSGGVEHFKGFREVTGYRGELFTDPSRESFRMLGFHSGIGGLLGMKALSKAFSAFKSGHTPGTIQGSALQLGGAVVISPEGEVKYHYIGQEGGDHPPISAMLAAI